MENHREYVAVGQVISRETKVLTPDEEEKLRLQGTRLMPAHVARQVEKDAKKHWDLFYKRNGSLFWKDRHWITREWRCLLAGAVMLEVGCGVGNLVFPLLGLGIRDLFVHMCDISPRAVDAVKAHPLYDERVVKAFVADICCDDLRERVGLVDVISMVFVLSAIPPAKWSCCLRALAAILKPGGVILFRDYGRYDVAQLRFKAGRQISDNSYARQDSTLSYFFALEELSSLMSSAGLCGEDCAYVQRRTVNVKEGIDVPRIFLQGTFRKPKEPSS